MSPGINIYDTICCPIIQSVINSDPIVNFIFSFDNKVHRMLRISPHIEVRSTVLTEIDGILQYLIRPFSYNTHIRRTFGSIFRRFIFGIDYTFHLS